MTWRPLRLIGQEDTDIDRAAVKATFSVLERLEKPVEDRLYEGEDHAIPKRENVLHFRERHLAFLAEHLDLQTDEVGLVSPAARD